MTETSDTFTCDCCKKTFPKERSDAEAEAEAERIFGVKDASSDPDMAVVCDDCWKRNMPQQLN